MEIETTVRPAEPEDGAGLAALFVMLDEHHTHLAPALFKSLQGPARDAAHIAELIASEQQAVLVAQAAGLGELLGFVHLFERVFAETAVAPGRRIAEVDAIVVREDCRGRGVGRRLLIEAEAWARERGLSALELNVRGFNGSARAAYEGLGFEILALRMGRAIGE